LRSFDEHPLEIETIKTVGETYRNIQITPETPILKAIEVIDINAVQIALVVDAEQHLLGTLTDGDVRRGLLRGIGLDAPVSTVMNHHPSTARAGEDPEAVLATMRLKHHYQIPIVDDGGKVVGLHVLNDLLKSDTRENWVLLMAGGLGTRLAPLTNDCPKPMLKVGGKPLLETIIEGFLEQGFHNFYLSVNYKAEMIQEYFGDGSHWGATIEYLHETTQLGTAGALSLLPVRPTEPLIVMNGDLLTKVNFRQLLDFHRDHHAHATMCVREYNFQVPYGVVQIDKNRLSRIDEKPSQRFFVNAGIYTLDPMVLDYLPANTNVNMTSFFETLIDRSFNTLVFPIREYWMDIGQMDDFKRANGEYPEVFK